MKNIYDHLFWTGIILVSFFVCILILIGVNIYPFVSDKLTKKTEVVVPLRIGDDSEKIFKLPQTPTEAPKETVIVKENPKPIQQVTKPVTVHDTVHDTVKIESVVKDTTSSKTP